MKTRHDSIYINGAHKTVLHIVYLFYSYSKEYDEYEEEVEEYEGALIKRHTRWTDYNREEGR